MRNNKKKGWNCILHIKTLFYGWVPRYVTLHVCLLPALHIELNFTELQFHISPYNITHLAKTLI